MVSFTKIKPYEPECNGICVMGYEILEGTSGVAYAHPDCELHGDPWRHYRDTWTRPEDPNKFLVEYTDEQLLRMEYDELCSYCEGGRLFVTGGNRHYSNGYNCYTQYAICTNCGPTEWECV